jgi:hypothetical protein
MAQRAGCGSCAIHRRYHFRLGTGGGDGNRARIHRRPPPRHGKRQGAYTIGSLPLGIYTATLQKGEKTVDTRANIPLTVGRGAEVDFACDHDQCAESANGAITAP